MDSALAIAASGLVASSLRLGVSANNIANAFSAGPLADARGRAATFPPAYEAEQVDPVALAGGGTAASVGQVNPGTVASLDPNASFADANGFVASPNVDIANEIVQQIIAGVTYTANAKVLQTASQMLGTLLDTIA